MQKIIVSGSTYSIKDKLKEFGCKWDNVREAWFYFAEGKTNLEQFEAFLVGQHGLFVEHL